MYQQLWVGALVSDFQHAFMAGRQILYAILIANQATDSKLKDNLRGILCKLDIEKAYDHINWNSVLAVLKKMGFGSKWLGWIRWRISIAHFCVLLNGSPSGFFSKL